MSPRVWFITGASSGFGRVASEHVLEQGEIVVATARKPEVLSDLKAKYGADKLLILKLDVTKPQEIVETFNKAVDSFGHVDVVFNNAGFGFIGEVEASPDEALRSMFETNFWGATNVSREAVRVFREVNKPSGGRVIVTSSMAGLVPIPVVGFYCAAKHALEAVTATLSQELDPSWNIKVTLVEPGAYETKGMDNAFSCSPHPAYTNYTLPSVVMRSGLTTTRFPNDVRKGVAKIYELSTLNDPPLHLALGKDACDLLRKQIAVLTENLEKYESWSEDLLAEN